MISKEIKGSELKIGDAIGIFTENNPKRINRIEPYDDCPQGPARIAYWNYPHGGITVFNDGWIEVIR